MVTIAGRRVKLALGRGKSQTINICAPAGVHGEYDWVIEFGAGTFSGDGDLLDQTFTKIEDFVSWLERAHRGWVRQRPIRRFRRNEQDEMVQVSAGTRKLSSDDTGVMAGTRAVIEGFFRLTNCPRPAPYQSGRAAGWVCRQGASRLGSGTELVRELYTVMAGNATASTRIPSRANWRREVKAHIKPANPSREKQIEKRIAILGQPHWTNQMPTTSGLLTGHERQRNVDLVRDQPRRGYAFIELKDEANTPLYAAMEVLAKGLTFLYSRRNRARLEYNEADNPVLWAEGIHLRVLAPREYYAGYALGWLPALLNDGLAALLDPGVDSELAMDFGFLSWPASFSWPCSERELLGALERLTDPY